MKLTPSILVVAVAATMWLLAAPPQLGGSTTYVTTRGNSMQPAFSTGDLAVLRKAPSYRVGDVVGYTSNTLSTTVMHRIVAIEDGQYVFRGDNNDFLDPDSVRPQQLQGKLALRIPQGGVWIGRLTSAPALAAMTLLLLLGGGKARTMTRRQLRRDAQGPTTRGGAAANLVPFGVRTVAAVALAMAIVGVTVILLGPQHAARATATAPAAAPTPAQPSSTTFTYRAQVPESPAYDGRIVTEPQPVFRTLADAVEVRFLHQFGTPVSNATVTIRAEMSTANGWVSTVPLADAVVVSGSRYEGVVEVSLDRLERRANDAAKVINGQPAGAISVDLVTEVVPPRGAPIRAAVPLLLDPLSLRPEQGAQTAFTVDHAPAGDINAPANPGVAMFGRRVQVPSAETAVAIVAGLALIGAALLAVLAAKRQRGPVATAVARRHRAHLLSVEPIAVPADRPVVDVADVDELVRLAQRYGALVLHWCRGDVHTYVVLEDEATYRVIQADDDADRDGEGTPSGQPAALAGESTAGNLAGRIRAA